MAEITLETRNTIREIDTEFDRLSCAIFQAEKELDMSEKKEINLTAGAKALYMMTGINDRPTYTPWEALPDFEKITYENKVAAIVGATQIPIGNKFKPPFSHAITELKQRYADNEMAYQNDLHHSKLVYPGDHKIKQEFLLSLICQFETHSVPTEEMLRKTEQELWGYGNREIWIKAMQRINTSMLEATQSPIEKPKPKHSLPIQLAISTLKEKYIIDEIEFRKTRLMQKPNHREQQAQILYTIAKLETALYKEDGFSFALGSPTEEDVERVKRELEKEVE